MLPLDVPRVPGREDLIRFLCLFALEQLDQELG
jgi:hypothetical protein